MGEIVSCLQPRSKLDALLSDAERLQLTEIYDTLVFDKSTPMKIGRLRTLLYYAIIDLKNEGQLLPNLWEDWLELNLNLRKSIIKHPDQAELLSNRETFLHLWKTFASSKRQALPGAWCSVHRKQQALADYDARRWKLHQAEQRLLSTYQRNGRLTR
jgi:hypothetical protein